MKEKLKKQFTELSDQELEKVNGGAGSIGMVKKAFCNLSFEGCPVGEIYKYVDGKCQCVPVPNTIGIR
ncbi:MAG: class IIb bacteriocin, lactobin A/cerein 7B family [Bacteroidales bacterium]|nr:class IIb bacteriocin, lactobin A/cerein 7B family [Bacteroidales bacterium]